MPGFDATGFLLLFGIVMSPIYLMFLGWFLGRPRDLRLPLIATAVFVGLVLVAWLGLYVAEVAFRVFF